jgi:hypothetical protein
MQTQNPLLKKPNEAVVMFPKIGKLTAYGRKFYVSLMREAQQHLLAKAAKGEVFEATDFFKEPLTNIIRPISKPSSNLVEVTKQYVREMQSTQVEWSAPDADAGVIWDSMVLVSQAKIELENGKLYLLWAFPPDMVNALKDPKRFTLIAPEDLVNLKSYAAVALYEICARYADNLSQRTSKKPKEWWVSALTGDSHKTSARSKESAKPREWRKFKGESVVPAIEEINKETGLQVELIEIKEGKAVVDIQFKVARKSKFKLDPTQAHIEAAKLDIPAQDITNYLGGGGSQEEALLILAKMKARIEDETKDPVPNRRSYFAAIVRKTNIGENSETSNVVSKEDSSNKEQVAATDQNVAITTNARMNAHVLGLSEDVALPLLEKAKQHLSEKKMLTPTFAKRLAEKNWRTGPIFHIVVDLYATENIGPEWRDLASEDMESRLTRLHQNDAYK